MSRGHKNVGGYLGISGDYTTGGKFSSRSVQLLKTNNSWGTDFISSGLQLFLDASSYSGSGTTWLDSSSNSKNFTWTSTPNFVSGSAPYFSTSGKGANGPASNSFNVSDTGDYTLIVVNSQNSETYNGAIKFYGNGTNTRGIFTHLNWVGGAIYWDQGGCCNADTRTNVSGGGLGSWNMIVYRRSSSSRDIIKNGTTLISNTSAPASLQLNGTAAAINNSDEGAGANAWDAKLAAVMLYNRALTDAELTKTLNIFKARYGF